VEVAVDKIIQVDAFDKLGSENNAESAYVRPALRGTKFAQIPVAV
jgi:hypothetical protein